MRRAFIAPLLLRTTSCKPHGFPSTQHIHNCYAKPSRRKFSMSLGSIETFQTTPFPQSVELATTFLKSLPPTLTPAHEQRVQALLSSSAGTRGLFVALLSTEDITLAETPLHKELSEILQTCTNASRPTVEGGEFSADEIMVLAVKNVTMSSAMEVTYKGRGEMELAKGSEMTKRRAVNVLSVLGAVDVAKEMVKGLRSAEGRFDSFSEKWGYGDQEIAAAVEGLREACGDAVLE